MTPRDHQLRLLEAIDRVHPFDGADGPLPQSLRQAFLAMPRHRFVHRYRRSRQFDRMQEVTEQNLAEHLPLIYSNTVLLHVDHDGAPLPSSNSEPGFILRVLEQLDLRPGQRVLEIGSGGGWLAAIMGEMVGPGGTVTGVEVIPDLVQQSRRDVAALGCRNVEIVQGDGAFGWAAGAPYDRVIVTAACHDLPMALHDQVRDGGLLIIPLRNLGGSEDLLVLRKQNGHFTMQAATLAYFVPFAGAKALDQSGAARNWDALPLWPDLRGQPCAERKLWFAGPAAFFEGLTAGFRAFLGRIDPDVVTLREPFAFGLVDPSRRSLALFQRHGLTGYGTTDAFERAQAVYRLWCERGMPGAGAWNLVVYRADATRQTLHGFPTCRGDSTFVWSLPELEN